MKSVTIFITLMAAIISDVRAQQTINKAEALDITVIERRGGLPQFLAERRGVLYSFAHRGDSVLENKILGLKLNIPRGLRSVDFEGTVRQQLSLSGISIDHFLFIQTVYFDFNSTLIRNDASAQLDKLAFLMLVYPFAKVEAVVHSDSRGSNEFNRKLAAKRGSSIQKYLEEAGVNSRNLSLRVSGEDELVNDCLDKVNCDELLHQLNRRAEFIFNPLEK
jgi:outer membrane protein OmpA-like peptidoglycan-associated protein